MIGLLTFHWADDFGAMLQAFALKRSLEALGQQVEIIPYAPFRLSGRYWWYPLWAKHMPDGHIKYWFNCNEWKFHAALGSVFWKRRRAMRAFRRRYLSARPAIRTAGQVSLEKYDCVFVGSDQVWNPEITVGLDDAYTGNLKHRGTCRMVAYAASLGRDAFPEVYWEKFTRSVSEAFSAVSVRERSAIPFLERLLHQKVVDLVDPVFLLRLEDWRRIGRPPDEKGYILLHRVEEHKGMAQYASALARLLDKKLIQTSFPPGNGTELDAPLCTGGPAEFLGYIQNAACVVTNSFHATAFSILYEKNFLVFKHSAYNSRLSRLVETLGLQSRIWDGTQPPEPERIWEPIDWASVQKRMDVERARSIQFIGANLEKAKG